MRKQSEETRGYRMAGLALAGVLAITAIALWTVTGSQAAAGAPRAAETDLSNPLAGWTIFRSDNTPAAAAANSFRARGMVRDAALMERVSSQPIATWLTNDRVRALRQVTELTVDAQRHRAAAVIVAYDVPGRSCFEGVTASDHGYLRWIGEIAAGIARRDTIVILEPDAIPFAISGCPISLRLLGRAVKELSRAAGARVYIDAGNPSWITPASRLVAPLLEADVRQAAGFSLNVANFQTTAANITYGRELSQLLGGTHFVIDTSRNGNGPETDAADAPIICDPPGRALGLAPTTNTRVPDLDAYLWVKPPGSSDGSCRPGAPPAGEWWTHYALELAANAES